MDNSPEFYSYKKLLIFGSQGSGKSSLVKLLKKGSSGNDQPENGNLKFI
jgi:GTPase SAR1 family protein